MIPQLVIVCGLSFAGKSTLGKALAQRFQYAEVDVDETKFRLYGARVEDTDLSQVQWDDIYGETDKEIEGHLRSGISVVDASRNFRKSERDHIRLIAHNLRIGVVTIYVNTPESVARERWLANRKNPSRRDVSDVDFEELVALMEPPSSEEGYLLFDYQDDLANWASNFAEEQKSRSGIRS